MGNADHGTTYTYTASSVSVSVSVSVPKQAENPDVGFRPTSGTIKELNFRVSPHVWGYFSVYGRGAVHP